MNAAPDAIALTLSNVLRRDRGRLLSALIRQLGDFQLAEDCLQEALEMAFVDWGKSGLPARPNGWLLQVARRKGLDHLRRKAVYARKTNEMAVLADPDAPDRHDIPDERLRLIFTCCHPALDEKSRVALTLRMLGGLSTDEIAHAFLDKSAAMGARLTRAKSKIRAAGIPFRVPEADQLDARLNSVLDVIYLIFNEGYSANQGDAPIRRTLCEEALFLAQIVVELVPDRAEVEGLKALLLLIHARHKARIGPDDVPVPMELQDRNLWDQAMITRGLALLDRAVARSDRGPFQIKAAIAALHLANPLDWRQIVLLYDALLVFEPTSVVHLNRAVALSELCGPKAGLQALDQIAEGLQSYQPFHAARADMLERAGDKCAALDAFDQAIALCRNETDIRYLQKRRSALMHNP